MLAALTFLLDLNTPRGISDWVWYFIPLLLTAFVPNHRLPFLLAGCLSILTVTGYFLSPPGIEPFFSIASRSMAICVMWAMAWMLSRFQKTEQQLLERSDLLDAARDAVLVRDLDDHILYWNKGAERIYGWTKREALGKTVDGLLCKERDKYLEAKQAVLQHGNWEGRLISRGKDGREIFMEARWTVVRDDRGEPKAILDINTDITERQLLEQQLLRAQRMESIGNLAGGIAHDLNNILTPVMISISLLKEQTVDADLQGLLNSLESNVRRGAAIVRQLLAFGRGLNVDRMPVSLSRVVRDLEKVVRETFPKSIQFELTVAPDIWTITGDSTQLHQVLLNLLINARDAMPQGGKLTLTVENAVLDEVYTKMHVEAKPGPYVRLKVTDTGTGIPPQRQEKIFEPFYTTKEPGQGTGLGLSMVLGIVKSHGGFINLYSEVGKGTSFGVYLPANTTPMAAETVAVEQSRLPRGHGELLLVVDDEESVRVVCQKVLERFGYRVVLACNGAEAVSLYAQQQKEIALVITDMSMPIMDGVATIVALKTMNPKVKVIASSGMAANGNVAKAAHEGVTDFIPKPYTAEAMLLKLDEVIRRPAD